jgi:hypothetical protein
VVCIFVAKLLCILAKQCVGKGGPELHAAECVADCAVGGDGRLLVQSHRVHLLGDVGVEKRCQQGEVASCAAVVLVPLLHVEKDCRVGGRKAVGW